MKEIRYGRYYGDWPGMNQSVGPDPKVLRDREVGEKRKRRRLEKKSKTS